MSTRCRRDAQHLAITQLVTEFATKFAPTSQANSGDAAGLAAAVAIDRQVILPTSAVADLDFTEAVRKYRNHIGLRLVIGDGGCWRPGTAADGADIWTLLPQLDRSASPTT